MSQGQFNRANRGCPHIVFLFSDTGGGHRSAAEAIIQALQSEYPAQTTHAMVDIFRDYAPALLARIPDFYPPLSRKPRLLGLIFHLSDGARRTRLFLKILWPFIQNNLIRLLNEQSADLFVSVHPLINAPLGRALDVAGLNTPYITVVTDLVSAHATWYWERSNLVVVPTQAALQQGVEHSFPAEQMRIVGLPIADQDCRAGETIPEVRTRLGWPQERPVIILVGGGEGMGPMESIAKAIDTAGLPVMLAVIAGRNQTLKARLEKYAWQTPTRVYGFIHQMPTFMRTADMLVTKAGPGTISEALAAGLPIILYSRLNGPEEGNVDYVVKNHVGVWAPRPEQVVRAIRDWLDHPEARQKTAQACLALARPSAAREIARLIMEQFQLTPQTSKP